MASAIFSFRSMASSSASSSAFTSMRFSMQGEDLPASGSFLAAPFPMALQGPGLRIFSLLLPNSMCL